MLKWLILETIFDYDRHGHSHLPQSVFIKLVDKVNFPFISFKMQKIPLMVGCISWYLPVNWSEYLAVFVAESLQSPSVFKKTQLSEHGPSHPYKSSTGNVTTKHQTQSCVCNIYRGSYPFWKFATNFYNFSYKGISNTK